MHKANLIKFLTEFTTWTDHGCGRHPVFKVGMNAGEAMGRWCHTHRIGGEQAANMGFLLGQALISQFSVSVQELEDRMAKNKIYHYTSRMHWLLDSLKR